MRETYTIDGQYETNPAGQGFQPLVADVLDRLSARETIDHRGSPTETEARPFIERNGTTYGVTIEKTHGSQEQGFLIDVTVEGRNTFEREDVQHVFESVTQCLEAVFDGARQTR